MSVETASPQIDYLTYEDDMATLRDRLLWARSRRVVFVIPPNSRLLSTRLELLHLQRFAAQQGVEVALVTLDPEQKALCRELGIPAFSSVGRAERKRWQMKAPPGPPDPPRRRRRFRRPIRRPPPRYWLFLRYLLGTFVFLVALGAVVGGAYIVIPGATITLIPDVRPLQVIAQITVNPDLEAIDYAGRRIPGRYVRAEVKGSYEVATTGTRDEASGKAIGTVLFTNLLAQDYTVPKGTVVRTSAGRPVRFATLTDVVVPALGQAEAPIEALEPGPIGNVGPHLINQVEGAAMTAVRVTNPAPTEGGGVQQVSAVTQADRDRVKAILMQQLQQRAYAEMQGLLEEGEFLPRQSLQVVAIKDETYTAFVTEPADSVGLEMRILVRGVAVDRADAFNLAHRVLEERVPPGYRLLPPRPEDFQMGEVGDNVLGDGVLTFFVTAQGVAAADLDLVAVREAVRGRPLAEAQIELQTSFPLAAPPQVTLWPDWMDRMPWLTWRIEANVQPEGSEVKRF